MPSLRFGRAVIGVALLLGAVTWSPNLAAASGGAPLKSDPAATTVNSPCLGGPGRMWLTVHAPAEDGTYAVDLIARGLVDDTRWAVQVGADDGRDPQTFHRRAHDGGWAATISVHTRARPNNVSFSAVADSINAPDGDSECLVVTYPTHPAAGVSLCPSGVSVIIARQVDPHTVAIRYLHASYREQSLPWLIQMTAIGGGTRETTSFSSLHNRNDILRGRVEFRNGPENQRYQVIATNHNGGQCRIGLNPGHLTASSADALNSQTVIRAAKRLTA